MTRTKTRIAIQKDGRLRDRSLEYLRTLGLTFEMNNDRSLQINSVCGQAELLLIRNRDIPLFVASGSADMGIVGQNIMQEAGYKLPILSELGFARCRLDIAVPEDSPIDDIDKLDGKCIATSYPLSLQQFLDRENITARIVELAGSVEIAPAVGLSDAICDLVASGRTLREHGLRPLCTVYHSQSILIGSPTLTRDTIASLSTPLLSRMNDENVYTL